MEIEHLYGVEEIIIAAFKLNCSSDREVDAPRRCWQRLTNLQLECSPLELHRGTGWASGDPTLGNGWNAEPIIFILFFCARYLTQMAAARLGAVLVNINPAYQPQELLYCLNKVGVKAVVSAERFKTQDYFSILKEVVPELESATSETVVSKSVPSLSRVVMMGETPRKGALSLEQVMEAGGAKEIEEVQDLQTKVDR